MAFHQKCLIGFIVISVFVVFLVVIPSVFWSHPGDPDSTRDSSGEGFGLQESTRKPTVPLPCAASGHAHI